MPVCGLAGDREQECFKINDEELTMTNQSSGRNIGLNSQVFIFISLSGASPRIRPDCQQGFRDANDVRQCHVDVTFRTRSTKDRQRGFQLVLSVTGSAEYV